MIAEAEITEDQTIQSGKILDSYSPKEAEKKHLLRKVKERFGIVKDICDRYHNCEHCDYMLEVLSHPLRYPDTQHCKFAAYTSDQLKRLLEIPLQ